MRPAFGVRMTFAEEVIDLVENHAASLDPTPELYARFLAELRDIKAAVTQVARETEALFVDAMDGDKRLVVDGLGEVEVKTSVSRTGWDNDALWRLVVARALDERALDEETGEYERESDAVARVLAECARPSWRVTPLKARGIQVDEFCTVDFGAKSVKLP